MKYCENCGKPVNENQDFCLNCGKILKSNKIVKDNNYNSNKNLNIFQILGILLILIAIGCVTYVFWIFINKDSIKEKVLDCSNYSANTFETIYESKLENEITAKDKYLNNSYIFNGVVNSIEYNQFTNKGYMKVQNGYVIATVYFNDIEQEKLKDYVRGDNINFCGTVRDISPLFGALEIDNSTIIDK